jgi:hypothetical protein
MPGDRRVAARRAGPSPVKHVLTADPLGASPTKYATQRRQHTGSRRPL